MPTQFDYQLPKEVPHRSWHGDLDAVLLLMQQDGLSLTQMLVAVRHRAVWVARIREGNFSRAAKWLRIHRNSFTRSWTLFLEMIRDDARKRKSGM